MDSSDRPKLQNATVVDALEVLRALDSVVEALAANVDELDSLAEALAAKVDDFDRRISIVESRLEENIPAQE